MVAVTGLGSGIDIDGLVASLIGAERGAKEARLNSKEADATAVLTAFGTTKSALSTLEIAADKLSKASTFSQVTASSSDTTKATITAGASASLGSYQLSVSSLATAQTVTSGTFSATSAVIGTGTLTIGLGTPTYSGASPDTYTGFTSSSSVAIAIDSSNNTLAGVRDAINAANAGVNAAILKNGSNYQLLLVAQNAGLANSISLTSSSDSDGNDSDTSGLSQLTYNASTANMTQAAAGGDASFSLNGLSITSSSNTITDVIDGVTLKLLGTTQSATTLSLTKDTTLLQTDVQSFVDAYNDYINLFNGYNAYNGEAESAGILLGDSSARSMAWQIRSELATQVSGLPETGYSTLVDVGISIDRYGKMSFNTSTFSSALAADADAVAGVFADTTYKGIAVEGVASKLETLLDGFISATGVITSKTSALNTRLASISEDRADLNRRMDSLEALYFRQFNAMDSLLAEIETTGNFLTQQFEAMTPNKD
jgi:flagellar hook-associated protein 2